MLNVCVIYMIVAFLCGVFGFIWLTNHDWEFETDEYTAMWMILTFVWPLAITLTCGYGVYKGYMVFNRLYHKYFSELTKES